MKVKFGQRCKRNIYRLLLALWPCLSSIWQIFTICQDSSQVGPKIGGQTGQGVFEIAYSRLCTGQFSKTPIVEKTDRCSYLGVGKIQGRSRQKTSWRNLWIGTIILPNPKNSKMKNLFWNLWFSCIIFEFGNAFLEFGRFVGSTVGCAALLQRPLLNTARLGAKRGYDKLQDNLENPKSFKIPALA